MSNDKPQSPENRRGADDTEAELPDAKELERDLSARLNSQAEQAQVPTDLLTRIMAQRQRGSSTTSTTKYRILAGVAAVLLAVVSITVIRVATDESIAARAAATIEETSIPKENPDESGEPALECALVVWLKADASDPEIDDVRGVLEARFSEVDYIDKERSLTDFKSLFRDEPELVASLTQEDLPTRFEVPKSGVAATWQLDNLDEFELTAIELISDEGCAAEEQRESMAALTRPTAGPTLGAVATADPKLMTANEQARRADYWESLIAADYSALALSPKAVLVIQQGDLSYSQPLRDPSDTDQWILDVGSFAEWVGPFDILADLRESKFEQNSKGEGCLGSPIQAPEELDGIAYGVDFWSNEHGDFGCGASSSLGIYTDDDGQIIAITEEVFGP